MNNATVQIEDRTFQALVDGPPSLFVCEKLEMDGAIRPDRSFWLDFRLKFNSEEDRKSFLKDCVIGSYIKPMKVYLDDSELWEFREAAVVRRGRLGLVLRPFSVKYRQAG